MLLFFIVAREILEDGAQFDCYNRMAKKWREQEKVARKKTLTTQRTNNTCRSARIKVNIFIEV